MISESDFKKNLINKLNQINPGWIDGDTEKKAGKKVDIVSHKLKIAIEIKDDTKHRINTPLRSGVIVSSDQDLTKMNQRLEDHIRSANRKFKEYRGYKTILLLRTEFLITDIVRYAMEGLHTYKYMPTTDNLVYSGRVSKYSGHNRKEIGCFLIFNQKPSYFPNSVANSGRAIDKPDIPSIFGIEFEQVQQV